jgi:hypothetical protein
MGEREPRTERRERAEKKTTSRGGAGPERHQPVPAAHTEPRNETSDPPRLPDENPLESRSGPPSSKNVPQRTRRRRVSPLIDPLPRPRR